MRKSIVAISTVTALTLAGCSSSGGLTADSAGRTPLRIIMIAAISSATLGANAKTEVAAAKAAVDTINAKGGVLGHPIELDVEDAGDTATTSVTKLQAALTSGKKPAVYIQSAASLTASAVLPIATQNKLLSFNISPTDTSGDPAKTPYNFDLSPSTANYAEAFCPQMKKMHAKTFGIVYNDSPFAESLTSEVAKQCSAAGLQLVGREKFKLDALDVTPQLSALQGNKPDVLVVSSYGAPSGYVLQGLDKLGWKVPVLGDTGFMVSPVVNSAPPAGMLGTASEANVEAEVFQSTVYRARGEQSESLTNMIAKMRTQGAIPAPLIVAYPYDAVILAAAAAEAAGTTTDSAKIVKAVESLPAGGPKTALFPAYHFSSTSHSANVDVSSFLFTKPTKVIDGQFGAPGSS